MWRKYEAMTLATPEGFNENPSLVWQFYHYRRETALKAQPNAAHLALASFSLPWLRHAVAPDSTFTLITQNVDGLSTRALQRVEILSTAPEGYIRTDEQPRMLEMHGRLFNLQCSSDSCEHLEYNTTSPVCESLAGLEALVEEGTLDPEIPVQSLPRCSKCGSLARPGVVWFGEIPQYLDTIDELVKRADLCIVVGTSSTVYPAAGYAAKIKRQGGKVAVFNLERSKGDEKADFLFLGPCEEMLPSALSLRL